MAIGFFTLQGTYLAYGDTPASGTVQVDGLPQVIVDTTGDKIKVGPKKVTLDTAGSFSIQLPTDSTSGDSTTLGYRVTARLKHANVDPVTFYAPAANATLNMADVTPVQVEPVSVSGANADRAEAAALRAEAAAAAAGTGGGGGGTPIGLDTDGVPYYNTAGVTGGTSVQTDADGVPYFV